MLLRFRFSNYGSFLESQELSLVAGSLTGPSEGLVSIPGSKEKGLRSCGIYGANASGKTTVFRALQFMSRAVRESHRLWEPEGGVPSRPHKSAESGAPSEFAIDFVQGEVRHQYGFLVNSAEVLEEWLDVYPNARKQTYFRRRVGGEFVFGRSLSGDNKAIAGLTRSNSLFLSAAAQNNHEILTPVYQWFNDSVFFSFGGRKTINSRTMEFCSNEEYRERIGRLLAVADLGIVGIELTAEKVDQDVTKKPKKRTIARRKGALSLPMRGMTSEERPSMQLTHQVGDRIVPFSLHEESGGTVAYIALLRPILHALESGTVLIVDELDASLHPLIAAQIIQFFNSDTNNPIGAQLIFNTHDTHLLRQGLLRRDQIWFTEKDGQGASHLYPLTEIKPRPDENLQTGYLQGRYGAIPFVGSTDLSLPR